MFKECCDRIAETRISRRNGGAAVKTSSLWLTGLLLSAASMMIETISYRQLQVFLRMDALPFMLPLVMAGMAAGAVVFYFHKRKTAESGTFLSSGFISRLLLLYLFFALAHFLLLPLCARLQPLPALLVETASMFSCFFLFLVWGYINSALLDRNHEKLFQAYSAILLGTIVGCCAAILLMDRYGVPGAISFGLAFAVVTAWFSTRTAEFRKSVKYALTFAAIVSLAGAFFLPASSLTVFHDTRPPAWFDSNSFSQLEMYPVEPFTILRAPSEKAVVTDQSKVQAWRIYFDGLDFYYTNIIRYRTLEEVEFLKQDLSNLAFLAGSPGRALILGAGGGVEVIQGLLSGYREIDAVDINPLVVKAIQHVKASDFMYATGVHYHINDARRFLHDAPSKYDLIFMPHLRGQGVTGVITSQFMNTVELMNRCMDMIAVGGTIAIRSHRQDWPSLFSTIKAALRTRPSAENWMVFLASEARKRRGYSIVFLHNGQFISTSDKKIDEFINTAGFSWTQLDLNALDDDSLVLTDDHPYSTDFRHLVKGFGELDSRPNMASTTGSIVIRFTTPLVIGLMLVLSLMILQGRTSRNGISTLLLPGGIYCACLGSGFLAAEIVLIEKMFLVAGNPTLAFGITVCSLLGGGMLALLALRDVPCRRLADLLPKTAITASFALCLAFFILEKLAAVSIHPEWIRTAFAGITIFIAGVALGPPFPEGVRLLAKAKHDSIPWSLAINGVAAVAGGMGAQLLAIFFGFRVVLGFALLCYIVAAITARRIADSFRGINAASAP